MHSSVGFPSTASKSVTVAPTTEDTLGAGMRAQYIEAAEE
jgi:hypothetical protein